MCVSHRSAIHMVNKGTEMLHKWTMLSGSYREKANSIGRRPTVQGEGQQYREKANSTGRRPTVQGEGQQYREKANSTGRILP